MFHVKINLFGFSSREMDERNEVFRKTVEFLVSEEALDEKEALALATMGVSDPKLRGQSKVGQGYPFNKRKTKKILYFLGSRRAVPESPSPRLARSLLQ